MEVQTHILSLATLSGNFAARLPAMSALALAATGAADAHAKTGNRQSQQRAIRRLQFTCPARSAGPLSLRYGRPASFAPTPSNYFAR
jgi:hypothetical protein